jgi:hypothetical protein
MNITINSGNAWESQVTQVGFGFELSAETDAEIDRLLGFDTCVQNGISYRDCGAGNLVEAPKYCSDDDLCKKLLDELGFLPLIVNVKKSKKEKANKVAGFFSRGDVEFLTVPFVTELEVHACVLLLALENKSAMT